LIAYETELRQTAGRNFKPLKHGDCIADPQADVYAVDDPIPSTSPT